MVSASKSVCPLLEHLHPREWIPPPCFTSSQQKEPAHSGKNKFYWSDIFSSHSVHESSSLDVDKDLQLLERSKRLSAPLKSDSHINASSMNVYMMKDIGNQLKQLRKERKLLKEAELEIQRGELLTKKQQDLIVKWREFKHDSPPDNDGHFAAPASSKKRTKDLPRYCKECRRPTTDDGDRPRQGVERSNKENEMKKEARRRNAVVKPRTASRFKHLSRKRKYDDLLQHLSKVERETKDLRKENEVLHLALKMQDGVAVREKVEQLEEELLNRIAYTNYLEDQINSFRGSKVESEPKESRGINADEINKEWLKKLIETRNLYEKTIQGYKEELLSSQKMCETFESKFESLIKNYEENEQRLVKSYEEKLNDLKKRSLSRNRGIDPSHNGRIDPSHDRRVDLSHDGRIDPSHNGRIDPSHDRGVDPSLNGRIDPSHDREIDSSHDRGVDRSHDRGVDPSHKHGFDVLRFEALLHQKESEIERLKKLIENIGSLPIERLTPEQLQEKNEVDGATGGEVDRVDESIVGVQGDSKNDTQKDSKVDKPGKGRLNDGQGGSKRGEVCALDDSEVGLIQNIKSMTIDELTPDQVFTADFQTQILSILDQLIKKDLLKFSVNDTDIYCSLQKSLKKFLNTDESRESSSVELERRNVESENKSLREKLRLTEDELKKVEDELEEEKLKVKKLLVRCEDHEAKVQENTDDSSSEAEENGVKSLPQRIRDYEQKLEETEAFLQSCKTDKKILEESLRNSLLEIETKKNRILQLENKVLEVELNIRELKSSSGKSDPENEKLKSLDKKSEPENEKLKSSDRDSEAEIEKLKSRIDVLQSQIEAKNEILEFNSNELERRIREYSTIVTQMNQLKDKHRTEMANIQSVNRESNLNSKLQDIKVVNARLEAQMNSVRGEKSHLERNMKRKITSLENIVSELRIKNSTLQKNMDTIQSTYKYMFSLENNFPLGCPGLPLYHMPKLDVFDSNNPIE